MQPFHYAFLVKDLESTRAFYGGLLGCTEGRSADSWVDFDFFGNQISAHVSANLTPKENCGRVDDITVPMPHFGAILAWSDFETLSHRLRDYGLGFVIEPRTRFAGQPGEQATMFLTDFSGNALEFKAFRNPEAVFTTN